MALARRLAILPGGLGGLGSSIGKKLREQGAHLAILYAPFEAARREELLESGYGGGSDAIRTYECDITAPSSVESAFHALEREMIRASSSTQSDVVFPSILINTAGYVSLSDMEMTPPEETMKHLTTNIFGPMLCSQAFARLYFAASKTAEASANPSPPGRIVNIASQAAHVALPRHGAYCASKAAFQLRVTHRGVDGSREEGLGGGLGAGGLFEDYSLRQDSSGMVNGADIRVDGGFTIQ
ncbi:hypothetical protein KXV52_001447 [Aspergillus fumigatus]|nr:hypothetical protein KXX58_002746 [Aspergillus fumigatus]KAH1888331.1 hypothetical protein KXX01_006754 [Aspergillus fumigatus]KAH2919163.1 hypothetical protein KXW73_002719 [Aspergillus fumigatus]KAH3351051.1 hypothetical protein KXW44_005051 [Aspergillus fumigatus]KAH3371201.1 hypothetical protein KXV52_001447 [Aspergillus fumigatus]